MKGVGVYGGPYSFDPTTVEKPISTDLISLMARTKAKTSSVFYNWLPILDNSAVGTHRELLVFLIERL